MVSVFLVYIFKISLFIFLLNWPFQLVTSHWSSLVSWLCPLKIMVMINDYDVTSFGETGDQGWLSVLVGFSFGMSPVNPEDWSANRVELYIMWVRLHSAKIYIWRRKNKPARVGANSHWLFTAGVALEIHSIWKWDSEGRLWLVGWQEGWFNDCRRLQFGQLWKAVRVGETEPVLGLCLFSRTLKRSVWSRRQRATILISRIIDSCIYSSRHLS